jgi:hypothetical protein
MLEKNFISKRSGREWNKNRLSLKSIKELKFQAENDHFQENRELAQKELNKRLK